MSASVAPLLELAPFLRPYRGRIGAAIAALVVAAAATLAIPWAFKELIDRGFSGADAAHVDQSFLFLFAVSALLACATAARYYFVSWLGERVTADLRNAVYANVIRQPPAFFEDARSGEVISRLSADTTLVQTVVGSSMSMGLRNLVVFAGGLVMLAVTSPQLTLYIAALMVAVIVPVLAFGRRVRKLSKASQDSIADASALAVETLNAANTVQAFAQEAREIRRFRDSVEHAFDVGLRRIGARTLLTLVAIVLAFGAVTLVLWLGAQDVLAGRMTGGELGAFVMYAVVTAASFAVVAEVWGDFQRAAGATERLLELYRAKPSVAGGRLPAPSPCRGALAFERVLVRYPARPDTVALEDFTLEVTAGERVALVGPSGAGKSTIFKLLLRFYEPGGGRIRIDGIDIADIDPPALRTLVGLVPQDPVIFSANALENIRYGRPEASADEVREAAVRAHADEFIRELPRGYESFLGDRGVRLSGGQRQRIAIARALLKNPPVLLLDEATSALDSESEARVQEAIEEAALNRTVLVIAHRLSTVLSANRIVVIDRGRVEAIGTHEELLRASPLYARLAERQFGQAI